MKKILLIALAATMFAACSKYPGYDKTDTGLYYKFITENDDAKKPEIGDVVTIEMIYKLKDSVIFSSKDMELPSRLQIVAPLYDGDIIEGITMMGLGDSASFMISADSFFVKNVGLKTLPEFIKTGDMLTFDVKLVSIQTKAEFEKEKALQQEKYNAMIEVRKTGEADSIKTYLAANKYTVKPTATGMYYIETIKGTGVKATTGSTVTVNYTGKFLNGTVFDSSVGKEPISFVLGNKEVIPGWEEGIALMKKGGKAVFVIPSNLAYGPNGAGGLILPYTPLTFDVELIDVAAATTGTKK